MALSLGYRNVSIVATTEKLICMRRYKLGQLLHFVTLGGQRVGCLILTVMRLGGILAN